ncbi:FMN-linked oxidoreductase [Lindgomyces ingoldianus]|uniref:FMN-linked oxidoreductase n=1 Tax=Lindgomyces ingoldianus TaxID=673940 RepID=A0ACB6Q8B9_9PLEO|nr:FMN-linked oxidoreductase [Lindgomyces ingoldianus]KAF2463173.1 FMN-linked oxidoreductase [Lindgomyces ingoldianus]
MKPLSINPPLLNSANPWCTTPEQLEELYTTPYTGAVTTRTSLLNSFPHDEAVHQFTFYDPTTHNAAVPNPLSCDKPDETGSLNTLGYSPIPLRDYLGFIKTISDRHSNGTKEPTSPTSPIPRAGPKPFIVSVTGSVEEVVECYKLISDHQRTVRMVLAMEVNLSCPNIPGYPPPAYNSTALLSYLSALKLEVSKQLGEHGRHIHVPIGIKTPPYTYQDQYQQMIDALIASAKEKEPKDLPCPISFITTTNTLGSSLLLTPTLESATSPPTSPGGSKPREVFHHTLNSATGTGIGGLAGAPLHPLALGNVYTIKGMLFQHKELEHIQIIGVGGVEDVDGYQRMRAVGAAAVGVGTALGRKGVKVFEDIGEALQRKGH